MKGFAPWPAMVSRKLQILRDNSSMFICQRQTQNVGVVFFQLPERSHLIEQRRTSANKQMLRLLCCFRLGFVLFWCVCVCVVIYYWLYFCLRTRLLCFEDMFVSFVRSFVIWFGYLDNEWKKKKKKQNCVWGGGDILCDFGAKFHKLGLCKNFDIGIVYHLTNFILHTLK